MLGLEYWACLLLFLSTLYLISPESLPPAFRAIVSGCTAASTIFT